MYFIVLGNKSMYPESLKFDFNGDRDEFIQQLLNNANLDITIPSPTYLVSTSKQNYYIINVLILTNIYHLLINCFNLYYAYLFSTRRR